MESIRTASRDNSLVALRADLANRYAQSEEG
jgi:hypothetical protein